MTEITLNVNINLHQEPGEISQNFLMELYDSSDEQEKDVTCYAFKHQVGGHKCVLQVTENLICKPCEESERIFYNNVPEMLQPYVPSYRGEVSICCRDQNGHKTLYAKVAKSLLSFCPTCDENNSRDEDDSWSTSRLNHCLKNQSLWKNNAPEKFIMFDNLIATFEHPCALDIKLCRYYHGICSDNVKRAILEQKSNRSTSSTLGFRIGGMQIYQHDTKKMLQFNKYYGMSINDDQAIEMLKTFFGIRSKTNIRDISNTLRNMHNAILNQKDYLFLSVSLLFFYDNRERKHSLPFSEPEPEEEKDSECRCNVRLIDFEKVIPSTYKDVHLIPQHIKENINYGMTNLANILDSFAAETDLIKK